MKIEIDFKEDAKDAYGEWTATSDVDNMPLTSFDVDTFWKSLWVAHDLLHEALSMFPSGELGVTLTSPSNKSLRYAVRKV